MTVPKINPFLVLIEKKCRDLFQTRVTPPPPLPSASIAKHPYGIDAASHRPTAAAAALAYAFAPSAAAAAAAVIAAGKPPIFPLSVCARSRSFVLSPNCRSAVQLRRDSGVSKSVGRSCDLPVACCGERDIDEPERERQRRPERNSARRRHANSEGKKVDWLRVRL